MAHLTHKLPWQSFIAVIQRNPDWRRRHKDEREIYDKKVAYFVRALSSAVDEFASTDKRSDEDKEEYDVFKWHTWFRQSDAVYGINFLVGFVGSVLDTYVALNLLVEDEARIRPVLFEPSMSILSESSGRHDGRHPEKFVEMLRPLLERVPLLDYPGCSKDVPKKLTPDVVDGIRKYCAELFKVMYTRPDVFTHERIEGNLHWLFKRLYKSIGERRAA